MIKNIKYNIHENVPLKQFINSYSVHTMAKVFPVVKYGCESWTVKKAERRRTDAFELWCWRRLLRVPWTARRYNQSILKEINPGISFFFFFLIFNFFFKILKSLILTCVPKHEPPSHLPPHNISLGHLGRNDAKAETPVLWPPHAKSLLI